MGRASYCDAAAIAVVSGVEPLLNAMQAQQQSARPAGGQGQQQQSAPNTGINFGIGLP